MSYRVDFYKTTSGKSPIDEFIALQDTATQAKIMRGLELLKEHGPNAGMPNVKYLGNKVYELRIRGKNEVRVFYVIIQATTIYLLHAFNKRTQKTPAKELKLAKSRIP